MLNKGNKQKQLPSLPECLSPLACQPSLLGELSYYKYRPVSSQHSLLNPSLYFFCLSSKTQLSSKPPSSISVPEAVCLSHFTLVSWPLLSHSFSWI